MTESFYELLKKDKQYMLVTGNQSANYVEKLEEISRYLKYPLRPYQIEALTAFQVFWKDGFDSRSLKEKTKHTVQLDQAEYHWHKISYEMATGSGKTLLMGAVIIDLWLKGFKDFLILTPNTILFDKTIENFTPRAMKSIFGDGWDLRFNIVTGNTYKDKTCNYDKTKDISFYIFNMQKFYEKGASKKTDGKDTMKGVPYVHRPIEESLWKDENDENTISFVQYMQQRHPVIISDEAHHYQQKATREAIKELIPSIVIEFTATSIEKKYDQQSGQDNIYKYPIQRYISEGYGKRIFALGCGTKEKYEDQVTESDKQKLIWGMLIHQLKKKGLETVNAPILKPMILLKTRKIEHANNVEKYLKNWPDTLGKELDDVLEQISRETSDIVKIIRTHIPYKKKTEVIKMLKQTANSVFTIHSENRNEDDVWIDFKSLEENDAEIVNQVRIFSEGVDYNSFYTVIVLGDTIDNVGVSAAQLIGRGLRLYKEKREFDILDNDLKEQSELLHVICERGKRFDKIIEAIRKKLELESSSIETPTQEDEKDNPLTKKINKTTDIPVLKIKPRPTGISFDEALDNKKLSVKAFIDNICGISRGDKVLKKEIIAQIDYAEITQNNIHVQHEKPNTIRKTITLPDDEIKRWAMNFIDKAGAFVGSHSFSKMQEKIKEIINAGIQVDFAYKQDYRKAIKALEKNILEYFSNNAYELMFKKEYRIIKRKPEKIFLDNKIVVRIREGKAINLIPCYQDMSSRMQQKGIIVEGYKKSLRPYTKFDSPPEKWVADKLEHICELDKSNKSFWIRNIASKEYAVEVYSAPFYPDLLGFINGEWVIVDVKGKHLSEAKQIDDRKKALQLLEKEGSIRTFFLVDNVMEKKGFKALEITSIDDFIGFDELHNEELALEDYEDSQSYDLFRK